MLQKQGHGGGGGGEGGSSGPWTWLLQANFCNGAVHLPVDVVRVVARSRLPDALMWKTMGTGMLCAKFHSSSDAAQA